MAARSDSENASRAKRLKTTAESDPRSNPYLAHMYENEDASSGINDESPLAAFRRHETTAEMANEVESGSVNPFTGKPFSSRYVSILKTRRDLPVHQQR